MGRLSLPLLKPGCRPSPRSSGSSSIAPLYESRTPGPRAPRGPGRNTPSVAKTMAPEPLFPSEVRWQPRGPSCRRGSRTAQRSQTTEKERRKKGLGRKGRRARSRGPYLRGRRPGPAVSGGARAGSAPPARSDDVARGGKRRNLGAGGAGTSARPSSGSGQPLGSTRPRLRRGMWRKSPSLPPFRRRGLPHGFLLHFRAAGQLLRLRDDGDGATW